MFRKASAEEIMEADSCTLTPVLCPVKALAWRYVHIKSNKHKDNTFLSSYWEKGEKHDVTDGDIRTALNSQQEYWNIRK